MEFFALTICFKRHIIGGEVVGMYEIEFYDLEYGSTPVKEFLDALDPKMKAKTLRTIDLLEQNGPRLRCPIQGL
jgi:hypothetical protein